MVDPLVAQLAEQTGESVEAVKKVLRAYRNALAAAVAPGAAARFTLFDLATIRVTTEPVGPMNQPNLTGKALSTTASIIGVYARTLQIAPTLTMRAALEPVLVTEEVFLGLFDEPWGRWRHAHGTAEDLPYELWLAASTDGDKRAEAHRKLRSNLVRSGVVYQASARAVPYLARLARSEELPERAELLVLVHAIAKARRPGDVPSWWDQHIVMLRKERSAFEAMLLDRALGKIARAILATGHFA